MVTLLKLGGSLITDKTQRETLRAEVLKRLATEIQHARLAMPARQLIIGHGSGSFGHFEARQHNTIAGVHSIAAWQGFARVATVAARLNGHVANALQQAEVPILQVQASASAIARAGRIETLAMSSILRAIEHELVPLVYGDVAFDDVLGGTILSTETIFSYLVSQVPVTRIILLGEVDGVYNQQAAIIPEITPMNFDDVQAALGGSDGVDVTGGMLSKVQAMLDLATQPPYPEIFIANGLVTGRAQAALLGDPVAGTWIRAESRQ